MAKSNDDIAQWRAKQAREQKREVVFKELKKAGQPIKPQLRKMLSTKVHEPSKTPVNHDFIAYTEDTLRGNRLIETSDKDNPIIFRGGQVATNSADVAKFLEAQPGVVVEAQRRSKGRSFVVPALPWKKEKE